MAKMQDFMISKVRVKLLKTFLGNPQEMYYIRQLTRLIGEEINAVRRELISLDEAGILKREKRGNRVYYSTNKNYLFYSELLSMVTKKTSIGKAILKNKNKLGKLKFVMISGRFARRMPRLKDTVDLLIVGKVIMPQLASLIKNQEAKLDREINYTVMTEEELEYRKSRRDPFIQTIFKGSRVMLIGDEEELVN